MMNTDNSAEAFAIRSLLDRYTDAVNQRNWDTYRACWTADAVWELHAPINGHYVGIEAIMTEVRRAVESQELFVQMNHAVTILAVNGDTARARATLNEIGKADPNGEGALPGVKGMNILAVYTDELVRERGEWKFKKRTYDVLLIDFNAPTGQVYPLPSKR